MQTPIDTTRHDALTPADRRLISKACTAYALVRYEEGYDIFVECYGTEEWDEFFAPTRFGGKAIDAGVATIDEAIAEMAYIVDLFADKRADAAHYKSEGY